MIHLTVNGVSIEASPDSTILQAARQAGIDIPTLCHLGKLNENGSCRLCVVEVSGAKSLQPACVTRVREGMAVETESPLAVSSRKNTLSLLCEKHRMDCELCQRYSDCEFHALLVRYGIDDRIYARRWMEAQKDASAPHLIRDASKCVLCRRCIAVCEKQQGLSLLGAYGRGAGLRVGPPVPLGETECVQCGQCLKCCPTGALSLKDASERVLCALDQKKRRCIALISPYAAAGVSLALGTGEVFEQSRLRRFLLQIGFDEAILASEAPAKTALNAPLSLIGGCPAVSRLVKSRFPNLAPLLQEEGPRYQQCRALRARYPEAYIVSVTGCAAEKEGSPFDESLTVPEVLNLLKRACVSRFTLRQVWASLSKNEPAQTPLAASQAITGLKSVQALLKSIESGGIRSGSYALYACPEGCGNGGSGLRTLDKEVKP